MKSVACTVSRLHLMTLLLSAGLGIHPAGAGDAPDGLPGGGHHPPGGPNTIFHTDVPAHLYSLVLGRPTPTAVTLSVLATTNLECFLQVVPERAPAFTTAVVRCAAGAATNLAVVGLAANTRHRYQFWQRVDAAHAFTATTEGAFQTARPAGCPFVFTVTADSHLDENTDPALYATTLRNALADQPDFHIDLGDTFMTDKRGNRPIAAWPQYLAQHYAFGLLCHAAPLFLVLGNHDGETGPSLEGATRMRTACFPNPVPNAFYSGDATGNDYAWPWGDALFVVLDPYRYTPPSGRGEKSGGWAFTLGRTQYDWLQATLQQSKAPFKFVFIHHLVGGLTTQGRGGAEAVPFFEWGGRDLNGRETFAAHRPGRGLPIHSLLVSNGVTAVFHGHDHFYASQTVDGIVYQLVPQPGHPGEGSIGQAANDGYQSGNLQPGSGYLRVTVSRSQAIVSYIRTTDATASGGKLVCDVRLAPRPCQATPMAAVVGP